MSLKIVWRNGIAHAHGTIGKKRYRQTLNTRDEEIAEQLLKKLEASIRKVKLKDTTCWVYALKSDRGLVKIGISSNPQKRINNIAASIGSDVKVFELIACTSKEAREIERKSHLSLIDCRTKGEWFDCHPEKARNTILKRAVEVLGELEEVPHKEN